MEQGDSNKDAGANEVIIPSTSSRVQSLARELTRLGELDTQSLEVRRRRTRLAQGFVDILYDQQGACCGGRACNRNNRNRAFGS
jgi:hypothetical protein